MIDCTFTFSPISPSSLFSYCVAFRAFGFSLAHDMHVSPRPSPMAQRVSFIHTFVRVEAVKNDNTSLVQFEFCGPRPVLSNGTRDGER